MIVCFARSRPNLVSLLMKMAHGLHCRRCLEADCQN